VITDFNDTHARLFQVDYAGDLTRRVLRYWDFPFHKATYYDFLEKYYNLVDWDTDDEIFKGFEATLANKFVGGLKAYKNVNTL
jgi:DNA-binding transcriptional regulator PaaX